MRTDLILLMALMTVAACSTGSKKPLETRMGKGKGAPEGWVAVIRPGNMIIELSGCPESVAKEALALASSKLPFRCRFLSRAVK